MSTTSSKRDALPHNIENARVFVVVYKGSVFHARKLIASAEASGNDTKKFIFIGTDGTEIEGYRNMPLDLPQGNPISVNRAMMLVAEMCHKNKDNFILLDADCTFLRPQAIERLSFELEVRGGTVLGQPIWTVNDNFHGWSWNGNAAYRWDTWEKLKLKKEPIPDDVPFDSFLSKKFFQGHCAGTGLFHNLLPQSEFKDLRAIPSSAVIMHSCSDGSVSDLVVKKYIKDNA